MSFVETFPSISKRLTMLYSTGSIEVKQGLYVEEKKIEELLNSFKDYDFESQ